MQEVTAEQAQQWLENKEAMMVDIRPAGMYAAERVTGAKNIPLVVINAETMPKTDKKIIIQCEAGVMSGRLIKKLGPSFDNLYNLTGGIRAWRRTGLPTDGSGKSGLPLDRQVQLTIGLFVLIFSLLAYFVHPAYALGSAFFGAGLTNAGLTGWCGLGNLISLMPWNR